MSNKHLIYLLGACVLFALVFPPTQLFFLSDDWDSLLVSIHPENILHSFRPLSDASLFIDYSIWKMNATGFHFTNLVLHFACVFCVYHFSKVMLLRQYEIVLSARLAFMTALLFLFYPFHSEALFWIVARGAILCTLFGLLCLIFFVKKEVSPFYFLLSLLCFAAALLSYEEAWLIPFIITIFSFLENHPNKGKHILRLLSFWLLFLFYLAGRFYFTQAVIGTPYGAERMMNFNFFFLCKNFFALVFRSFVVPMQSAVIFSIICVVTAIIFLALFISARKKINFILLLSPVLFFLSLIPVLPLGMDTHDTESERFLYFPSVFFIIFLVQFFDIIGKKKWLPYVILFAGSVALWVSYQSFVKSSSISKKTVRSIQQMGAIDTLFARYLPDQYKGGFIFRNGFASMIQLEKKDSAGTVKILSRSELFHPESNYKVDFDTARNKLSDGPFSKNNLYVEWQETGIVLSRRPFKK